MTLKKVSPSGITRVLVLTQLWGPDWPSWFPPSLSQPLLQKASDKGPSPRRIFYLQPLAFSSHSFLQLEKKKIELSSSNRCIPFCYRWGHLPMLLLTPHFCRGKKAGIVFSAPWPHILRLWKDTLETQLSHFKQVGGKWELDIFNLFFPLSSRSIPFVSSPLVEKVFGVSLSLWRGSPGWLWDRQSWSRAGLFLH